MNDRSRLPLCDLAPLAVFLFSHPWQTRLAHAVHRDPRLVRRWVAGECPISAVVSERIEQLVRDKHSDQMRGTRAAYRNMIAGLSDTAIRGRLLAMDLSGSAAMSGFPGVSEAPSGVDKPHSRALAHLVILSSIAAPRPSW